ncbi:MAG: aldo/keto reductase [Clostridiales Family XIII bacterium]|jgi:predicted aldo/keto reductase-like oxidoreductase|nr:aldo/keto reductase [Clostridiales Family XIII bacterium]
MTYLGENIKKLGFGFMRLPMLGNEADIEQVKEMVDVFMNSGFSYFDSSWAYMDGKSEEAMKTAIVDRYPRESFQIATKCPVFVVKTAEEARDMFWTSLQRIPIPKVFGAYNRKLVYDDLSAAQLQYSVEVFRRGRASDCIACGECERVCPQHIGIIEILKVIGRELAPFPFD